jgi:hypothetical protein
MVPRTPWGESQALEGTGSRTAEEDMWTVPVQLVTRMYFLMYQSVPVYPFEEPSPFAANS